ncbi:SagB family peptide dehydrogenase [Neobacillus sp. YIM B06451]|uniref:SagB family peptide dehydrogenase n=1 Tax=Neobacillus sp. YIM B06451 TaxID=3070994 RepID=UPI00292CC250|nr:SagB family peptide dehydrogenase [Neobacillus sp. YIM B06451]
MELETFLYKLHFDTDKVFPPDWQVDWEDAPLPYKLYRGLPEIQLTAEVPLTLKKREGHRNPSLEELGHFLWYVYGLTQFSQSPSLHDGLEGKNVSFTESLRRFVPSGGALYPNELYVYVKMDDVPKGIYHYDVAHHRLILLREGNYDDYLSRSLDNDFPISDAFCTVFISTVFWKNFYKYNNFSYRLQGLDAGVIIGQTLEVANQMGFYPRVCYQFLDRSLNHLLGISEQEESVYAVIPLTLKPSTTCVGNDQKREEAVSATELSREVPVLNHATYNRSKRVIDYPLLRKLNEASMFETTQSFVKVKKKNAETPLGPEMFFLPAKEQFSFDFASACRNRYSPGIDFTLGKVSQTQLSTLLNETFSFLYQNDLDLTEGQIETRVSLYGSFYQVEGIPDGAYSYDNGTHALQSITKGDHREFLQAGLTMPFVNMYQVPLCMNVVGDTDHLKEILGVRGYRIQLMEAGILVQRLLLVSCALGMGGHALLGFDANQSDELFRIESKGKTCLIQIPIGPTYPHAWLQGSLRS